MKKFFIAVLALSLTAASASAQSGLLDALRGLAGEAASQILNTVTVVSLPGTWTYQGSAVDVTAGDAVSTIAANAAVSTLESKADGLLAKAGINPGAATFTFKEDGSFVLSGKKSISGTWSQDGNAVTLRIGKIVNVLTLQGTAKVTTTGCELLFDADNYLAFLKKILSNSKVKSFSSELATISTAIEGLTGADAGFKLVK